MRPVDPVADAIARMFSGEISPGLERMKAACHAFGDPQDRLGPVVHVAGTNGKGSVVAVLGAIARQAGLKVNGFTSPHLVFTRESIRVRNALIGDVELLDLLNAVAVTEAGSRLTAFEALTLAAFLAFRDHPADLTLIEAGMGGSEDSTNVIARPLLSVITPIAMDHHHVLGASLEAIAAHKAGILKAGARGIVARQSEAAMAVIEARAAEARAPLTVMGVDFDVWDERGGMVFQDQAQFFDLPAPGLKGPHQVANAGLAVAVALELDLPAEAIAAGVAGATWPARMQRLSAGPYGEMAREAQAELWLDGGHNPHAGRALAEALAERQRKAPRPLALIVGMLANKDHGGFFEALKGSEAHVFTVGFEGSAADPSALAAVARGHGLGAQNSSSVEAALSRALRLGAGRVVICGSLYLAGEVLGASEETWPS